MKKIVLSVLALFSFAVNYFQALPLMLTTDTNISSDSSFSLQGPYAGLKWVGTLA